MSHEAMSECRIRFDRAERRLSGLEQRSDKVESVLDGNGKPGFAAVRAKVEIHEAILFPEVGQSLMQSIKASVDELKEEHEKAAARAVSSASARWAFWGMVVAAAANVVAAFFT